MLCGGSFDVQFGEIMKKILQGQKITDNDTHCPTCSQPRSVHWTVYVVVVVVVVVIVAAAALTVRRVVSRGQYTGLSTQ